MFGMSNTHIIELVTVLVVMAAIVIAAVVAERTGRRHTMLRRRFGPEYDRARRQFGPRAEKVLAGRLRHVEKLHIRPLSHGERARFSSAWTAIQAQFVDDPRAAVTRANDLVEEVMRVRGYAGSELEQRCAELSVHYPNLIEPYRAAHALVWKEGLTTETLRQAVVHYRAIFGELLEEAPRRHDTPVMLHPRPA
jgi:hypothetical protein